MSVRQTFDHGGSERGQSLSVLFAVVLPALLLVIGLVIDGGAQAGAARRAESAAAAAARAAVDATAASVLAGRGPDLVMAREAGLDVLAGYPDVTGEVRLVGGMVEIETIATVRTQVLMVIGITTLSASGQATAELRR